MSEQWSGASGGSPEPNDELKFSPPEYLAKLHQGVVIVLASVIVTILVSFAMAGLAFVAPLAAMSFGNVQVVMVVVLAALGIVAAYGWWLVSTPDPEGRLHPTAETARKIIRVVMLLGAAITCASTAHTIINPPAPMALPTPGGPQPAGPLFTSAMAIQMGFVLISMAAAAVMYFVQMMYVRWLAPRLPDAFVFERAKMLMWLGPLLYTVGMFCLGLGPIVALVLHWNLLDRVRKDLKRIRAEAVGGAT